MPSVATLIRNVTTPTQAQEWLRTLQYNKEETMFGLAGVTKRGTAHCLEAAISVCTILEHHGSAQHRSGATGPGYPPLILDLESKDNLDHTLFLYQHNGKFGTVAMSRDVGLFGRRPVYKNIFTLVQSYAAPYIDQRAEIFGYGVLDLRTLRDQSWRTSTKQLWYIEDALREMDHFPFHSSRNFVRKWRKKYLAFQQKYPGQQPDYFPQQQFWL